MFLVCLLFFCTFIKTEYTEKNLQYAKRLNSGNWRESHNLNSDLLQVKWGKKTAQHCHLLKVRHEHVTLSQSSPTTIQSLHSGLYNKVKPAVRQSCTETHGKEDEIMKP